MNDHLMLTTGVLFDKGALSEAICIGEGGKLLSDTTDSGYCMLPACPFPAWGRE